MIAPLTPSAGLPTAPSTAAETNPLLAKTAKQFEAIFMREMLAAARKSNFGDTLFSSSASDNFREMQDARFADISAEKGTLGLAKLIEAQLARQTNPATNATGKV
jgi:flagellar protein FlgJ